jgi:hypothetical protein
MTIGRKLSELTLDELAAIEARLMSSVDTDAGQVQTEQDAIH